MELEGLLMSDGGEGVDEEGLRSVDVCYVIQCWCK